MGLGKKSRGESPEEWKKYTKQKAPLLGGSASKETPTKAETQPMVTGANAKNRAVKPKEGNGKRG